MDVPLMCSRALSPRNPQRAFAVVVPAAALLIAALSSTSVLAAEADLQNGIGAREKALAGAGVASSTDATAASLNPAGLVNIESQLNVSASFLYLNGGYTSPVVGGGINADGHHDSDPGLAFIPNLAATWRVNWGLVDAVALTVYGNAGVNTHYKDVANANCPVPGMSGVFCGGPLGIKMAQSFYSVAFAKQILPGISVGVAPIVARQTVQIDGGGLFAALPGASIDPANFSNKGTDESWGVGARAGVEWKVARNIRLGLSGNAPIHMSNFDKYRGLLAEQGGFDVPGTLQAGVALDVMPNLTLLADYKHVWFSSVASIGNPSTKFPGIAPFGADNGAGFGVKDVDVVKLGLEWRHSPDLTLRAGYSYNTAPIGSRDADLNIVTLGIVQHHLTGGLKYQLNRSWDVELAAMYAPRATITGVELLTAGRPVEIEMSQFEFTVGAVYRFGSRQAEPLK
jgi:long-chain fatty acid transport protein